jgi:acetyl esterase/lipase
VREEATQKSERHCVLLAFAGRGRVNGSAARYPNADPLATETISAVRHGGFLMAERENALDLRTYIAEAGFVVASMQYRTVANGASYREGIADVKSAIRYLRANAMRYG